MEFKEPKTRKSRRTVTLGAQGIASLKRQEAKQNAVRLRLKEAYDTSLDLVFDVGDGKSLKPDMSRSGSRQP